MNTIETPIMEDEIKRLNIGDMLFLSGNIFCGRDAVLPKIVQKSYSNGLHELGIDLQGGVIFHTAVSIAGVGPTSSNKTEIEASIEPLSEAGIRIHLGKGRLQPNTVEALKRHRSVYAVIPPVTAMLNDRILGQELIAYPELGMEGFYKIRVVNFPIIIAAAHGKDIYDDRG